MNNNPPLWLNTETVIAIHTKIVQRTGGLLGVRDINLLESALARPQHLHQYLNPSVFDLAAAYAFGICKNHPFIDGNKRVSFIAAYTFLYQNGYELNAPDGKAIETFLKLAEGNLTESILSNWLEKHSQSL